MFRRIEYFGAIGWVRHTRNARDESCLILLTSIAEMASQSKLRLALLKRDLNSWTFQSLGSADCKLICTMSITPLFSEGLSLKLDETLNTLWGVKEDPHGTPKSQRNNISQRNSYYLFSPGLEPGTSRRGWKSRRREDSKLLVFFSVASEMTNQFVLARTMY